MLKTISTSSYGTRAGVIGAALIGLGTIGAFAAPKDDPYRAFKGNGLEGFASQDGLDDFAAKMADSTQALYIELNEPSADMAMMSAPAMEAPSEAPADAADSESITNTQEAGVDEGGIVKNAGDYLVVLRRGRLFTVRTGDGALEPIDTIDAFPPGKKDPSGTWYDEMLVAGDQVIVIGYSYSAFGTELNRFKIGKDGQLTYRDTHYLRSGDYYSSSNYASRLIGDELILYTPVFADWNDLDGSLPAIRDFGEDEAQVLVKPQDFLVAEPYRSGHFLLDMLHTVTRCDLSTADLECSATAIAGTYSRSFYVSRAAVYTWTGKASSNWRDDADSTPGQLYRIPLDGSRPGAVQVSGAPVDQFSFSENAGENVLRVLLRSVGNGDGMWASEYSVGNVSLATIPIDYFDRGQTALVRDNYRKLPEVVGWSFHNRFVGDYLLYAGGAYGSEEETPMVYAVPLDGRDVQNVAIPHGTKRFDKMGNDGIVIGPSANGELGFTSLSLGREAKIEDTYLLAAAGEGESRSQAFFFKPDTGSSNGHSGTLGLPITRRLRGDRAEFLGSGSAIAFLRRDNRNLTRAGELVARTENAVDDNCIASCVDWYGNARPIFMGGRIFALMGYEIVEGSMSGGRIREARRVNFAQQP